MRVALITPTLIPNHAVPNSIINKFNVLVREGHDVAIFAEIATLETLPKDVAKNTFIIDSSKLEKFYQGKVPFSEDIEKWLDAELYIFDYPHYYHLISQINKVEGIVGFIYHGITPPLFADENKQILYTTSMKFVSLLQSADFGIVYSEFTKNELTEKYKISPKKIYKIPFGVDIKKFSKADSKNLLSKYNLENKTILTYVGRIYRHKNIEFLIKALPEIIKFREKVVLMLIGDHRGDYESEKNMLESLAKELGIINHIKFTSIVEDLPAHYHISDIIVNASLHEGCWVPGLEAIAAGKPILASDTTAMPYTVGKAGLFFDPGDQKDFLNKVKKILNNQSLRKRLSKFAKSKLKYISIEAHDKEFIKILKRDFRQKKISHIEEKITQQDLVENLNLLQQKQDIHIDYYDFSGRKYLGYFISKFRYFVTKHLRFFYLGPLEGAQINFNNQMVKSYNDLLKYLSQKEKWNLKFEDLPTQALDDEFYNKAYFIGGSKSNYGDYGTTKGTLIKLAEMLNKIFPAKSWLDIGCAYGFLPMHLREKGVKAFGIDISAYAISKGNKSYLSIGNATDLSQFKDKQFEVVSAIEFMEHIPEKKVDQAIKEVKRVSQKYIVYLIALSGFASHDHDHDRDISHITMKNRKFWLKKFEKLGLTRDIEKERELNMDPYSLPMGWSGRFFVLKV